MHRTLLLIASLALSMLPFTTMAEEGYLNSYRSVELPSVNISSQKPFSLADDFLSYIGIDTADTKIAMNVRYTSSGYIFDFQLRGYLDDSLKGENYRIVIEEHENRYFISGAGVQYLCARGENTSLPQSKYCP